MKKKLLESVIEIAFILFLFYSNLLMGEFTASGRGKELGLIWALKDIFTISNFLIGLIAALIGYVVFEFLRERY